MTDSASREPSSSPPGESLSTLQWRQLHHSVRNSLQLIIATLHGQARQCADPQARTALRQAIDRLGGFARVHRHLQELPVATQTEGATYLRGLLDDLRSALLPPDDPRAILLVEPMPFTLDTAQVLAFGSIVNELVTNAVKHGDGDVIVGVRPDGASLVIEVESPTAPEDAGEAVPASADATHGFGLKMVGSLCGRTGGRVDIERHGAMTRVIARLGPEPPVA